jgi:hypothetical protein
MVVAVARAWAPEQSASVVGGSATVNSKSDVTVAGHRVARAYGVVVEEDGSSDGN